MENLRKWRRVLNCQKMRQYMAVYSVVFSAHHKVQMIQQKEAGCYSYGTCQRLSGKKDDTTANLTQGDGEIPSSFRQTVKKERQESVFDGVERMLCKLGAQSGDSGLPKLQLEKSLTKIESTISGACKVLEQLNLPGANNDKGRRAVATNSRRAVTTAGPPTLVIGRDQDRDNIIAMLHEKEDKCQANVTSGVCYSVIGIHGMAGAG
ncbi:hypothetical protein CFC21_105496 [Triticum aestivum]|uniref:NB-ARC domain-containing protein n=2 Tax=Triticum aestivum TaxID=4565 RepID=A0A3B6STY5_WHEAT|nr:hypothetical protein CFC21_105496 [Triticum aestivum]